MSFIVKLSVVFIAILSVGFLPFAAFAVGDSSKSRKTSTSQTTGAITKAKQRKASTSQTGAITKAKRRKARANQTGAITKVKQRKTRANQTGAITKVKQRKTTWTDNKEMPRKAPHTDNILQPLKNSPTNHAGRIFIQNYDIAKLHPANGYGLENASRVLATGDYLKERFPYEQPSFDLGQSDPVMKIFQEHFQGVLEFLHPDQKDNPVRQRLAHDSDLVLNNESIFVAKHAARLHYHALEQLLSPNAPIKRALSLARPPGHHASYKQGGGFCLINHMAVLLASEYLAKRRALIIDFDIHQGDGTEQILNDNPERFRDMVQFISVHVETPTDLTMSDKNVVPFFPGFYVKPYESNEHYIHNLPINDAPSFTLKNVSRLLTKKIGQISVAFPNWKPDIVLFSAGFDGHRDEIFHGGFRSKDYRTLAKSLMNQIAESFKLDRWQLATLAIVEGGYNENALKSSVENFFLGLNER